MCWLRLSKNVEMTGERERAYDRWRKTVNTDFLTLPFVEYSRLRTSEWPRFQINAVIFPNWSVIDNGTNNDHVTTSASPSVPTITMVTSLANVLTSIPIWQVLFPQKISSFECIRIDSTGNHSSQELSPGDFIRSLLNQTPETIVPQEILAGTSADRAYSAWHRTAMPSGAGVMDIDYIEFDGSKPFALIEATRSNDNNLEYGLFSFLSRGYAQASIYLQLAETLGIDAYVATYQDQMDKIEVLKLDRSMIGEMDEFDRSRQALATKYRHADPELTRSQAQGMAVSQLYENGGQDFLSRLSKFRRSGSLPEYLSWLNSKKSGTQK